VIRVTGNTWKRAAAAVAAATGLAVSAPAAAQAATVSGEVHDFYYSCDATVILTDNLAGSPGRIEAWGGWSCPNPTQWGGNLQITLYRNGAKVATTSKNFGLSVSDSVGVSVPNPSGKQNWKATIRFSATLSGGATVNTGTLSS
jgi:hypothetical protein